MTIQQPDIKTYITQRDLEQRWKMSGRTLERWRSEGYGPPWYVFGGSIRYRLDEIEAFEARGKHGRNVSLSKREGDA